MGLPVTGRFRHVAKVALCAATLALGACGGGSSLTSSDGSAANSNGGGVSVGGSGGSSGGGSSGGSTSGGGTSGGGTSGGGTSGGGSQPGEGFAIEVEGLVRGQSITVSLNGQAPAVISQNGVSIFFTPSFTLQPGASYTLTLTQVPFGDTCTVAAASGIFVGGYAVPSVTCEPNGGSPSSVAHLHARGPAATQGPALPVNRSAPAIWMDAAGNLWLFGGLSAETPGSSSALLLNDLWKFMPATGQWLRIQVGTIPEARMSAASWVDAAGDFWLSGGTGAGSQGESSTLADVWRFSPGTQEWTEVSSAP